MKEKIKKILSYLLQVVLTALASAIIAMLQNYVQAKGVEVGPSLDVADTSLIGGVLASGKVAISNIKKNMFF